MINEPLHCDRRRYTFSEIVLMRQSLYWLLGEDEARVEDQLRTYMQNGTDPEELRKESQDHMRRRSSMESLYATS